MEEALIGIKNASNTVKVNQKEDLCLPIRVDAVHSDIKNYDGDLPHVLWYGDVAAGHVTGGYVTRWWWC